MTASRFPKVFRSASAGRRENADHRRKAALAGVGERGPAVAVGDIHIGPGCNQFPDDFYMCSAAVAEDDGLQQRGPAELVDVILINGGSEQNLHRLDMPVLRGRG